MIVFFDDIQEKDGWTISAPGLWNRTPLDNLKNDTLYDKWIRLNAGEQAVTYTGPNPAKIDYCAVGGVNFAKASIAPIIQLSNDNFATLIGEYELAPEGNNHMIAQFEVHEARYARLIINTSGVKSIGKIKIGLSEAMPPMAGTKKGEYGTTKKPQTSKSGQNFQSKTGYEYEAVDIPFEYLSEDEWNQLLKFYKKVLNQRCFFMRLWDSRGDLYPLMYGKFTNDKLTWDETGSLLYPKKSKLEFSEAF